MITELLLVDIILRVIITFLLTGLIGIQREYLGKPAGIRTHILVGLGACLTILTGYYVNLQVPISQRGDVTRIAAQVISGIGFLGAGTIVKKGDDVQGLTTGASLWLSGCVGIAVGCGFWVGAVIVTIASLTLLERHLFKTFFYWFKYRKKVVDLKIFEENGLYFITLNEKKKTSDSSMAKLLNLPEEVFRNVLFHFKGKQIIETYYDGYVTKNKKYIGFESLENCEKCIYELNNVKILKNAKDYR